MVHLNIFHLSVVVCGTPGHPRVQVTHVITMARINKIPEIWEVPTIRFTHDLYHTSHSLSQYFFLS